MTANPPQFFTTVDIRTGDGSDTVALGSVENQTRAVFSQPVTVDTGAARDTVTIQLAEFRNRLNVNTGTNPTSDPEYLNFDRSEVYRPVQFRMGGQGVVLIRGFGLLPARFRAGLIITMATGMVLVGGDDSGSRVIFDSLVWVFGSNPAQPVSVQIQSSIGVVLLNRRRLLTQNAVVTG